MTRIRFFSLGLALLLAPLIAGAQAETAVPTVNATPIKGSLHLLQGKGGNVLASVGEDGILIIDDDYTEYADAYHQALKALAGNEGLPRFVINTHWHFDHVGGNAYWGERGAVILAHTNVYQRMSTRQEMKVFERVVEPSPASALPVVTYGDALALHFNGDQLEVQHYPRGHTDGDSIVFFIEENVVHMGDHFFKDRFPFVDMSSGGTVDGFINNVAVVLNRVGAETTIVPGHGDLADQADLKRYHAMLLETRAEVRAMQNNGMGLEAIVDRGLDDKWESWGSGFINEERWITFLVTGSTGP